MLFRSSLPRRGTTIDGPRTRGLAETGGRLERGSRTSHHQNVYLPDFRQALAFVNKVGELAEEQGHHPDIYLTWGKVEIKTWTHKIDGLTESDFILAAKIDQLARS